MAICHMALAFFCQLANNIGMATVNHIRKLLKTHDITLEVLSERTGISTAHLSRIQRGKRGLSLENAILIARALGVSVHEVDESFSSILTDREDQATSLEKELIEVLPKLSKDSQKSLLQTAQRLQELEERASSE